MEGTHVLPGDHNVVQPPYFTNRETEALGNSSLFGLKADVYRLFFIYRVYSGNYMEGDGSEQELIKLVNIWEVTGIKKRSPDLY